MDALSGDSDIDVSWYLADTTAAIWTIDTANALHGVAVLVSSGITFDGKTIRLSGDIDMEDAEWTPIGTADAPFAGTFDGDYHTISNIKLESSSSTYQGLFGYTSQTAVIEKVTIDLTLTATADAVYVGGIVAYNQGEISAVTMEGSVTGGSNATHVAGIAAYNTGTITVAQNSAAVQGAYSAAVSGSHVYIAGIAAHTTGVLDQSENSGAVTWTVALASSVTGIYIGGIAGLADAEITDCYNSGTLNGTSTGGGSNSNTGYTARIGGVVGSTAQSVLRSGNGGGITATVGHTYYDVGGIAGYAVAELTDCYNTAAIDAASSISASYLYVGGIVGYLYTGGQVTNARNNGTIAPTGTSGTKYAGGIAGYIYTGTAVFRSFNTASVTLLTGGTAYAGGIVGYVYASTSLPVTICNSYNLGAVTGPTANNTGGIAGTASAAAALYLYNSYTSETKVLGNSATSLTNAKNNYYLDTTDTTAANANGAFGRTAASMQDAEFLRELGFAFAAQTGDYPALHWYVDPTGNVVEFNYNESTLAALGVETYTQIDNTVSVTRGSDGTVSAPDAPVKEQYYSLEGWYLSADCSGDPVTFPAALASGTTLYAKWSLAKITITFHHNYEVDGQPVTTEMDIEYNSAIGTAPIVSRAGYRFMGWYAATTPTGDLSVLAESDLETQDYDMNTVLTAPYTLYAKWAAGADVSSDYQWYTEHTGATEYFIATSGELLAFGELVNGGAPASLGITAPVSFSGKTVTLTADIDLTGIEWAIPIGASAQTPFQGTFNGNTYSISNLTVTRYSDSYGLFGVLNTATVKSLTLSGTLSAAGYTGALAGQAFGSNFEAVTVNATVTGSGQNTGGLIGYAEGCAFDGITTNAVVTGGGVNTGGVTGYAVRCSFANTTGLAVVQGTSYVGGIAGLAADSSFSACGLGSGTAIGGATYTGGIAGGVTATANLDLFMDCNSVAKVTGTSTYTGGLAGATLVDGGVTVQVARSENSGEIRGSGNGTGGLIGYYAQGAGSSTTPTLYITTSENNGIVTGTSYAGGLLGWAGTSTAGVITILEQCANSAAITGTTSYIGGLIGYGYGTSASALTDCINTGVISGKQYTGGIAGYLYTANLSACQNSADITGTGTYTGGLVGYALFGVNISDSYNEGDVTGAGTIGGISGYLNAGTISGAYNTGNVTSTATYTGGIVGSGADTCEITLCYNTGDVTCSSTFVGGIAGRTLATVRNSYNTGAVQGSGSVGGIAGAAGASATSYSQIISVFNLGTVSLTGSSGIKGAVTGVYGQYANFNCYYLDTCTDSPADADYATAMTADAFANYAVAYLLDGGGRSTRSNLWTQGAAYPVFAGENDNAVYQVTLESTGSGSVTFQTLSGMVGESGGATQGYVLPGDDISLTITPDSGQILSLISITNQAGTVLYSGSRIDAYTMTAPAGDILITTVFAPYDAAASYTVTFSTDGGTGIDAQTVQAGQTVTRPADPTKVAGDTTYEFVGWYTDEALSTLFDFNTAVTADLTLYAKWQIEGYQEPSSPGAIQTDATITSGGSYVLDAGTTGTISIETTDPVVLIGADEETYARLTIKLYGNSELTIENLQITSAGSIDVAGENNTIYFTGENEIACQLDGSNSSSYTAGIHVPLGASVTIDEAPGVAAGSYLYLFRAGYAAAIGGNSDGSNYEACGTITINGGTLLVWTSQIGSPIGRGGGTVSSSEDGIVTINGGEITLYSTGGNSRSILGARLTVNGGTLSCQYATANNSGIVNIRDQFTMSGGSLTLGGTSEEHTLADYGDGSKVRGAQPMSAENESIYRLELPYSRIALDEPYRIETEDGTVVYEGSGSHWKSTQTTNISSTAYSFYFAKLSASDREANFLYNHLNLYLTGTRHVLTIYGKDASGEDAEITLLATRAETAQEFSLADVYTVTFAGNATAVVDGVAVTKAFVDTSVGTLEFSVEAMDGYQLDCVTVEGETDPLAPNADGVYTLSGITADTTVCFETARIYQVTFTGTNATASMDGASVTSATVAEGGSITFTVQAASGYTLKTVYASGASLTQNADGSYTASSFTDDAVITMTATREHTITFQSANAAVQVGGSTVTSVTAEEGTPLAFAVVTDDGYSITSVTASGGTITGSAGSYTLLGFTSDVTVTIATASTAAAAVTGTGKATGGSSTGTDTGTPGDGGTDDTGTPGDGGTDDTAGTGSQNGTDNSGPASTDTGTEATVPSTSGSGTSSAATQSSGSNSAAIAVQSQQQASAQDTDGAPAAQDETVDDVMEVLTLDTPQEAVAEMEDAPVEEPVEPVEAEETDQTFLQLVGNAIQRNPVAIVVIMVICACAAIIGGVMRYRKVRRQKG